MEKEIPTIKKEEFTSTPMWHFVLSIPIVWGIFLPMVFLDLLIEIYHHVCFPLYGLKLVKRNKFFFFDRLDLPKLNSFERLNCTYCSYANGVTSYWVAIAGETEAYWCAIRHRSRLSQLTQPHTKNFIDPKDFE